MHVCKLCLCTLITRTITLTIRKRSWTHNCWRCKDQILRDLLKRPLTPLHGHKCIRGLTRTENNQLEENIGYLVEDCPEEHYVRLKRGLRVTHWSRQALRPAVLSWYRELVSSTVLNATSLRVIMDFLGNPWIALILGQKQIALNTCNQNISSSSWFQGNPP